MKLLFLDIDGVLNDHRRFPNHYSPILPELVERLNIILAEVPEVKLVLSSAWRYSFPACKTIETLLAVHGCCSVGRIHGRTRHDPEKWSPDHPHAHNREYWNSKGLVWRPRQIRNYARRACCSHFVVLDDIELGMPELVKTDPLVGLTHRLADEVIRRFQEVPR